MLTAGQTTNVTFKVNVMGTQAEPKVRVILGGSPELSFPASSAGESWVVPMNVPSSYTPGSYDLRVEVTINNRVFTPINKKIEVVSVSMPMEPAPTPTEIKAAEPVQDPVQEPVQMPDVVSKMPAPVAKMPDIVSKKTESMMKSFNVHEEKERATVKTVKQAKTISLKPAPAQEPMKEVKAPVQPAPKAKLESLIALKDKKHFKIESQMPKPSNVPAKPIRVKLSEVDAAATKPPAKLVNTVRESKVNRSPKSSVPIVLIKEELFYE